MQREEDVGELTISYRKSDTLTPVSLKLDNIPQKDFMTFMRSGRDCLVSNVTIYNQDSHTSTSSATLSDKTVATLENIIMEAEPSGESLEATNDEREVRQETEMSDLNRNEIQALLKANKAEVDAVASKMQTEMSKWRETMSSDLKDIKHMLVSQNDHLNSRFDIQSTRIEAALDAHSKKIDAALSVQEAKLEGKLSDVKLDIIKWALGLPALAFTVYKLYGAISGNPTP